MIQANFLDLGPNADKDSGQSLRQRHNAWQVYGRIGTEARVAPLAVAIQIVKSSLLDGQSPTADLRMTWSLRV
jgi:hypothetical protein